MIQLIWVVSLSVFWSNQQWLSRFQCLTEPDRWIDQSFSSFVSHFVWGFHTGPLRYFPKIHGRPTLFFGELKTCQSSQLISPHSQAGHHLKNIIFPDWTSWGPAWCKTWHLFCAKNMCEEPMMPAIYLYMTHIYDIYIYIIIVFSNGPLKGCHWQQHEIATVVSSHNHSKKAFPRGNYPMDGQIHWNHVLLGDLVPRSYKGIGKAYVREYPHKI